MSDFITILTIVTTITGLILTIYKLTKQHKSIKKALNKEIQLIEQRLSLIHI